MRRTMNLTRSRSALIACAGNMANKAKTTTAPTPKGMRPGTEAVDDRDMDLTFKIVVN